MDFVRSLKYTAGGLRLSEHALRGRRSREAEADLGNGTDGDALGLEEDQHGKNMLLTFVVELVASFLIAYVVYAAADSGHGEPFAKVFQVVGTIGVLTYSVASLPNAIWFQANHGAVISG